MRGGQRVRDVEGALGEGRSGAASEFFDSAMAFVAEASAQSYTFFVVETLSYLHRSGRLGKTALALGSALKLKPLFMLRDGAIKHAGIVRTVPRSIPRIFASFDAEGLRVRDLVVAELNPGLAAHTGPGTLAVSVMPTRVPTGE
ncbi:DegV family protein [Micrococcales bacterium 31B]|nr:DegV family protein [Micrococcales bacterium 31B]